MNRAFGLAVFLLLAAEPALADPPCGVVELRFKPAVSDLQIVTRIEESAGKGIDTPFIPRAVGQFGLANRPGSALLKTDFRWPYGRRDMIFPVWAHRRNHPYPRIVMGGICGNSKVARCPNGQP